MKCTLTLPELAAFASLSSAHFNLNYPAARGFDEGTLPNFPCGGQNTVSSNRTLWPISGGSIALTMGHIDANVEVLIVRPPSSYPFPFLLKPHPLSTQHILISSLPQGFGNDPPSSAQPSPKPA